MSKIRRIVIGDVHGHYDALMTLLEAIAPSRDDIVYFLGDLIDRGPHSAQVVKFVRESGYPCLLGNHEQMLMEVFSDEQGYPPALQAWLYSGGHATVNSYGEAGILPEDLDWLHTLPLYIDLGEHWLVHAGLHPNLPLEAQTWEHFCWIRDEFHSIREPYFPDKLIVTGHTITFTLPGVMPGKLAQGSGWIDIDTGAYHPKSGWLTGLDLTNHMVYQVNTLRRQVRSLTLEEATTLVEPSLIPLRRQMSLS